MDGDRVTLEIRETGSVLIGRNRQDQLKGVKAAGAFRDLSSLNPPLCKTASKFLAGTVLDGELTEIFTSSGEYDETTRERQKIGEFLGYTVWGVLFARGRDVRNLSESSRFTLAGEMVAQLKNPKIRLIERVPCTKENLARMFKKYEGAVAKKLSAPIPATQRTNTYWFKIKGSDERTVDAFITDVQEGKSGGSGVRGIKAVPNGKAASFTMSMLDDKGKAVEVCKMKHLPDIVAEKGYKQFSKFANVVVEMRVSGWNGKAFRWPKWVRVRMDKGPQDCILSEQLEKEKT
jgi:hypothetical protein